MCPSIRILNRTKNGTLTFCNDSKLFQLVFNNLCFEFYEWELDAFRTYVAGLNVDYWEQTVSFTLSQRKIPISVGNKHFVILVSKQEVYEIRALLHLEKNKLRFLTSADIDYRIIEN